MTHLTQIFCDSSCCAFTLCSGPLYNANRIRTNIASILHLSMDPLLNVVNNTLLKYINVKLLKVVKFILYKYTLSFLELKKGVLS